MVSGIGQPMLDYQLAINNQSQLLSEFQKTPSYAQAGRLLQGQYRLGDHARRPAQQSEAAHRRAQRLPARGRVVRHRHHPGQLLTQDPTQSTSLAQQLIDPRFTPIRQGLRLAAERRRRDDQQPDQRQRGPRRLPDATSTQKFVSNLDNDPTIRQALFFQQTVQDTIDVSDTAKLFTQFQQSPAIQQAIAVL